MTVGHAQMLQVVVSVRSSRGHTKSASCGMPPDPSAALQGSVRMCSCRGPMCNTRPSEHNVGALVTV